MLSGAIIVPLLWALLQLLVIPTPGVVAQRAGVTSYTADTPELSALIGQALEAWGASNAQVEIVGVSRFPDNKSAVAEATVVRAGVCEIRIHRANYIHGGEYQLSVIMHEVGHCLGLPHLRGGGIMDTALGFGVESQEKLWLAIVNYRRQGIVESVSR